MIPAGFVKTRNSSGGTAKRQQYVSECVCVCVYLCVYVYWFYVYLYEWSPKFIS